MPSTNPPGDLSEPHDPPGAFTIDEITRQYNCILESDEFHATESQRKLFDFVIQRVLAGQLDQIKGYTIATQVFGRNLNFDQSSDPIVSIQANKLRRTLERYYLTADILDPIRIDIPKGTYVPVFYSQKSLNRPEPASPATEIRHDPFWPSVLIKPFRNLSGDPEQDFIGMALSSEVMISLSCYQEIRIIIPDSDLSSKRASDFSARFVVDGNLRQYNDTIIVNIHMVDTSNNIQVFGESYKTILDSSRFGEFQDKVSEKIAYAIASDHGAISKAMINESKARPINQLTAFEAILRYYEFNRFENRRSFATALEALTHASIKEPGCGQVWTMLGRLHAVNCIYDIVDSEITLEKALSYAVKGAMLNPGNQRARVCLAFIRTLNGDIAAAKIEAERALKLNSESYFFMDVIGLTLTMLGEWERGTKLIRESMTVTPNTRSFVCFALWLNDFRKKDYDESYRTIMHIPMHRNFLELMSLSATLGQLGNIEEGRMAAEKLLKLKPDFQENGHILIGYFIKFEEIFNRVLEGLAKVGIHLEKKFKSPST